MAFMIQKLFRENALPAIELRELGAHYLVRDQVTGEVVSHYVSATDKAVVSKTLDRATVAQMIADATAGGGNFAEDLTLASTTGSDVDLSFTFNGSEGEVEAAVNLRKRLELGEGVTQVTYASVTVNDKGLVEGGSATLAENQLPAEISGERITGDIDGNAGSATKLATARTIGGKTFDGTQNVELEASDVGAVGTADIGVTVAPLVNGLVPSENLPNYVDDVIEVDAFDKLPGEANADPELGAPEKGKLYVVVTNTGTEEAPSYQTTVYRWSGTVYVQILDGVGVADQAYALYESQKIEIGGAGSDGTWEVMFKGNAAVIAPLTLATTGVTAGDYGYMQVDAKGRVLYVRELELDDIPKGLTHEWVDSAKSIAVEDPAW